MKWLQSPQFMMQFHGWATIFFIVLTPVSIQLGWINALEFVAALSLWALVAAHWSAWQSVRVEMKQDKQREEQDV